MFSSDFGSKNGYCEGMVEEVPHKTGIRMSKSASDREGTSYQVSIIRNTLVNLCYLEISNRRGIHQDPAFMNLIPGAIMRSRFLIISRDPF